MTEDDALSVGNGGPAMGDAQAATISIIECFGKIGIEVQRVALFDRFPSEHPLETELRGCVVEYVRAVRVMGTPPEAAIVLLKRLVESHLRVDHPVKRSITNSVVGWMIAAYFDRAQGPY